MPHAIIEAIERRTSVNHFDPGAPLADAQIERLVELATRAPSAFNLQNWRFIAVRTDAAKERLRALAWNQPKVGEAAVTFIVCGVLADHATLAERLQPAVEAGFMPAQTVAAWEQGARGLYAGQPQAQRDEAFRSASLAAATMMLAAEALGLGSGAMCGFDAAGVAREFALAPSEVPVLLLTVGRRAAGNWPQKPRRPLSQVLEYA